VNSSLTVQGRVHTVGSSIVTSYWSVCGPLRVKRSTRCRFSRDPWSVFAAVPAFRALQGFFGGSMIPTAFTAAVILFQGRQKAVAASFVTAAAGVAPTLGPIVGGWITDTWSWH
jgi:MFS family permease